ncbi:hypothetical protein SAMN05216376_111123 [Mameliella alba]|uniref:hypothetical protein n=1 Tax=Mameliella alba TaxID=561184 RepID=UPI00088992EB|nr:hypothetical protein [Mameliella alba]OWV46490.1 hypothetical protein CDZ96_17925 [Mameliella alba]PTR37301.1 hypothetical protein LX94_03640 [Mameliella alba]SDD76368.1 hypothetical protein SAMN05216376_111123 [Mameliella alba]
MTRARLVQNAFSSGEIDPRLFGRNDFTRFKTGLAECRGFIPLVQGGFTRAPGTERRGETRNNSPARRIPFSFAQNDAVELEFTDSVMRVWRYGDLVMDGGSPYELATPFEESDLPNLDWAQDGDVIYLVDGRNPMQKLSRAALDDWSIADVALDRGPFRIPNLDETKTVQVEYLTGGAVEYWQAEENLTNGDRRQYGSNIYIYRGTQTDFTGGFVDGHCGTRGPTHTSGTKTYEMADTSGGGLIVEVRWEFDVVTEGEGTVRLIGSGDPFDAEMVGGLMLIEPVDFEDVPVWVGNDSKRNGKLVLYADNIYRHIAGSDSGVNPPTHVGGTRMTDGNSETKYQWISGLRGIVRITSFTDANEVEADQVLPVPRPCFDSATYLWAEGAWSDKYGYPAAVELHERRLFAAATPSDPRTVWGSQQGDFEDFLVGDAADAPLGYTLATDGQKNRILWLATGRRGLFIGSLGEVYRAYSSSQNEAIGPTTFATEIVAPDGAREARPIAAFGDPIYPVRGGGRVQEVKYSFEVDGAVPRDLSLPSRHLAASPIEQIEWQGAPGKLAWMRRADGLLLVLLYEPEQEVLGWAPVPVAGGFVEDITVSPAADGTRDVVTLTVLRTLDGGTVRTVEQLADNEAALLGGAGVEEFNHLYCASIYEGAATSSLSVPHLANETVTAWTDGGDFPGLTVAGDGTVTLPGAVTRATVGLFDDSHRVETLPLQAVRRDGDQRGRPMRLHSGVGAVLHRTAGGQIAAVARDFGQAPREGGWIGMVPEAFDADGGEAWSGATRLDVTTLATLDLRLRIRPQGGRPLTVLALVSEVEGEGV